MRLTAPSGLSPRSLDVPTDPRRWQLAVRPLTTQGPNFAGALRPDVTTPSSPPLVGCAKGAPWPSLLHCSVSGPHGSMAPIIGQVHTDGRTPPPLSSDVNPSAPTGPLTDLHPPEPACQPLFQPPVTALQPLPLFRDSPNHTRQTMKPILFPTSTFISYQMSVVA